MRYSADTQADLIKHIVEMIPDFDDLGLIDLVNAIDEEIGKRFRLHDEKRKEEAQEAKAILRRVK
jgi:hypothetical protein